MAIDVARIEEIRTRHRALAPVLDERRMRLWAAAEAKALGRGGIAAVTEATGIRGKRIGAGLAELAKVELLPQPAHQQHVRQPGGGRKLLTETDPELWPALEMLVDPVTRGDPESPLRWTVKSTARLAQELRSQGHDVSARSVAKLLREHGYSLQATHKTREGRQHPDRNAQFEHINAETKRHLAAGQPVISVDTKKKELVGDFANKGREWHPHGQPPPVRVHDFIDNELGKVIPYGVYDVQRNEAWVSVGIDHDTAAFAVATIRTWWNRMGTRSYPEAKQLLVVADSGGSNANRSHLWKFRAAETRGRHRAPHQCESHASGHQQVEQDRAPAVLAHLAELARSTPPRPRDHRQPDRQYDHGSRAAREGSPGPSKISNESEGPESQNARAAYPTVEVPRRMELRAPAAAAPVMNLQFGYCFAAPNPVAGELRPSGSARDFSRRGPALRAAAICRSA
jgi:hypothetical protein